MFWLLLAALLLVCAALLGLALLTLWRRVKGLSRQVADVGGTVGEVTQSLSTVSSSRPQRAQPCPTCGAPASAAVPANTRQAGVATRSDAPAA